MVSITVWKAGWRQRAEEVSGHRAIRRVWLLLQGAKSLALSRRRETQFNLCLRVAFFFFSEQPPVWCLSAFVF